MLALAVAWSRPAWRTILGRGGHSMGDELPALPPDTVLASIGRFATRYPDGRWLDALARRASQGALDAADVLRRVRQGRAEGLDPRDLAWLGFLVAADPRSALQDVVAVLDHALAPPDPPEVGARVWSLYLQALYGASGPDALGQFGPDRLELVDPHCRWGVETDSMNPFLGADASPAAWLAALSRPFTESGAAPLELSGTDSAPFDRLAAGEGAPLDGDLVSVIMPVYNPDQSLLTAASLRRGTTSSSCSATTGPPPGERSSSRPPRWTTGCACSAPIATPAPTAHRTGAWLLPADAT